MGDSRQHFETEKFSGQLNYKAPHVRVKLPIFIIHGNHDDPSSDYSSIELLGLASLLNYFSHTTDEETISISPILFTKNHTKIALYGMGNIKEDLAHRLFAQGRVFFEKPEGDDWFHILVLHQNRFKGNGVGGPSKSTLRDDVFPEWLDFIVWGHEHECIAEPVHIPGRNYSILQPGSTVATSIIEPESRQKWVGILSVSGRSWSYRPIPLHNIRPMLFRQITITHGDIQEQIHNALEDLLATHNPTPLFEKPLVKLKIRTNDVSINTIYYKNLYSNRSANNDFLTVKQQVRRSSIGESDTSKATLQLQTVLQESLESKNFRFNSPLEFVQYLDKALASNNTIALENLYNAKMTHAQRTVEIPDNFTWMTIDKIKNTIDVSRDEVAVSTRKRHSYGTGDKSSGKKPKNKGRGTIDNFFEL